MNNNNNTKIMIMMLIITKIMKIIKEKNNKRICIGIKQIKMKINNQKKCKKTKSTQIK